MEVSSSNLEKFENNDGLAETTPKFSSMKYLLELYLVKAANCEIRIVSGNANLDPTKKSPVDPR